MSAPFTPGPWRVSPRFNNFIDILHTNKRPGAITMALCRVQARQSWLAEAEANARLIAAAPTLLAALERLVTSLSEQDEEGLIEHAPQMEEARAAIAKATGRFA